MNKPGDHSEIEKLIQYLHNDLPTYKLICVPPLENVLTPNTWEWINPDTINFVQFTYDNYEAVVIISFKQMCDRGLKTYRSNQAEAIKYALNKISINPLKE